MPVKTMKNIDTLLSEFDVELYKLYNTDIKATEYKELNKDVYEKYRNIKENLSQMVKKIEASKKDFINNEKDVANISINILNIKELSQNSFLGDSDVINEMFENSLLVRGLFSSDSGALIFLNMNVA